MRREAHQSLPCWSSCPSAAVSECLSSIRGRQDEPQDAYGLDVQGQGLMQPP